LGNEIHARKGDLIITLLVELEHRLPEIYENPQTNEDIGDFVINSSFEDSSNAGLRDVCDEDLTSIFCEDMEGKKKVSGLFRLIIIPGDVKERPNGSAVTDFDFRYDAISSSFKRKVLMM